MWIIPARQNNGLPSSFTTAFHKLKVYTLIHPSLFPTPQTQFLLTCSCWYKLWFFLSLILVTKRQGLCCSIIFPLLFFRCFRVYRAILIPTLQWLQLQWNSFNSWNQDTTEIQSEAKQVAQARTSRDTPQHTTCLLALLETTEEDNWSCLWLYFPIPKGVNLHVRAQRVTWPQVQLQKMLFMLGSWQTGINGIKLLLHKAVSHRTSPQSYCLIPDLDRPHLGVKSATVIHSCWFNKLCNRLHSRPHWSPTQKGYFTSEFS